MQIPFEIGDHDLTLHWHAGMNWFQLEVEDELLSVNTWWHPTQQLGMRRRRRWTYEFRGHRIEIEKFRPRFLPAMRTNEVVVRVDGEFTAREFGT